MDIESLVDEAKRGSHSAVTSLVEVFRPLRESLIRKFYWLDREDLDQDLIIVLLEAIGSYESKSSRFAWYLKERSRWYCLDRVKGQGEMVTSLDQADEDGQALIESVTDGSLIENDLLDRRIEEMVVLALKGLDEKERKVIYLHYYLNYSYKDIALRMGLSQTTISRLKAKAFRKLKKILGGKR